MKVLCFVLRCFTFISRQYPQHTSYIGFVKGKILCALSRAFSSPARTVNKMSFFL